jgi:hypothetical protein
MRDTIFDNLVNCENDFTELLCNMIKFKEFKNIFSDFIGIKCKDTNIETQYRTEKNGRPDIVISYNDGDGIEFIEVKVGNSKLTKNQPTGYIKELSGKEEKNKKLHFIIPRNYYYIEELNSRIGKIKNSKELIEVKYWENFFDHCKQNKIFLKNKIFFEYYNLLKSWFGYENVKFNKGERNIMNKNGKTMAKAGEWFDYFDSYLDQNGFKLKASNGYFEIGGTIRNKKGNISYGWIGIWFPLWKEKGHCFTYMISNDDKKHYNNFKNKYKCYTYNDPDEKTIYKYICFDDDLFEENCDNSIIFRKILDIIENIKSTKVEK